MKFRTIGSLALIASLGFGSVAMAQPDHGRGHDGRGHDARGNSEQHRQDARGHNGRGHDRHDADRRDDRRGYSYGARGPEWRRGGRLPSEYRNRQYVVNDWRGHRLSAPPRGQQWVQVGGDYVLASIATGVIVQLLLNN